MSFKWPDEYPAPDKAKAVEQALPDAADAPQGKKGKPVKEPRPVKEKARPTWGIPASASTGKERVKPGGGWRGETTPTPEYAPVDKAALKRSVDDAKWAAQQQRDIAKSAKQQARSAQTAAKAARKANEWQAAADREIAQANRGGGYPGGVAATEREPGGGRRGCGCLTAFTWIPGWVLILLLVLLLLLDIWQSGG